MASQLARYREEEDVEWIIELFLFAIKGLIKNPGRASTLKKSLLEIRDDINLLYPGE